jgi:hypothetical protein
LRMGFQQGTNRVVCAELGGISGEVGIGGQPVNSDLLLNNRGL